MYRWLTALLTLMMLASTSAVSAQPSPSVAAVSDNLDGATSSFQAYLVHLAPPNWAVVADAPGDVLDARLRQRERDELSAALDKLHAAGEAGSYSFDDGQNTLHAQLSDDGRAALAANPLVGSIEPEPSQPSPSTPTPSVLSNNSLKTQTVSSIDYVQVFSPFMWGKVSAGGFTVDPTLLASDGTTVIGVPCQQFRTPAQPHPVVIDNSQLYFETVFVSPGGANASSCTPQVNIMPNDIVQVITSSTDPNNPGQQTTRITVDDIDAWTSYQNDTVSGAANVVQNASDVFVTIQGIGLSSYLTPSSYHEYDNVSAGSFSFSTSAFCPSTNQSCTNKTDLKQGSTGFVRVHHPDGNEVYTIHGQNVLPLENGSIIRGWTFGLPGAIGGLTSPGVTVPRPQPQVSITLNHQGLPYSGTFKGLTPYTDDFSPVVISGNDTIDVQINQGHINQLTVKPMTATINLGANQITGSGPPNTRMVLNAGHVDGYVTKSFTASFLDENVTTDGAGNFTSTPFKCGSTDNLNLQPGSFGYTGYEDQRGNFIYLAFAAPTTDVMANYPFIEGWVAKGTDTAAVTLKGAGGTLKDQQTVAPLLIFMSGSDQIYVNVYYNLTTAQFIVPGDMVTVNAPGSNLTIPVDNVGGMVNTEAEFVSGQAPPGSTVRVVPLNNRQAYDKVTVGGNGNFTAGNPFSTFSNANCNQGTTNMNFNPGDGGRVYVQHADGSQVFGYFGRSIIANENDRFLDLYLYSTHGVDWFGAATNRPVTVTLTPPQGTPTTVSVTGGGTGSDHVTIKQDRWPTIIRAGDSITATFAEGPDDGPTQTATISFDKIPLVTGSPDLDTSTLAGVGPSNWWGTASLLQPISANKVSLTPRPFTAYGPFQFTTGGNKTPVTLGQGYNGQVSFTDAWNYVSSDASSHQVWIAWAVTIIPVKIIGFLHPGDTQVCGKGPPGATINIYDVTDSSTGLSIILGTSTIDSQGKFCVTVSPLHAGQVVIAGTPDGNLSQPVVVLNAIYLPTVFR